MVEPNKPEVAEVQEQADPKKGAVSDKGQRRKIPGGLPYTSSPGVLRRVLDQIPTSEKPSTFNTDFLSTVMGATGGAARPIVPILKSTGLLNQVGAPTELYAQFQTEAGRPQAALQALKNGFPEVFRRNQYANRAEDPALTDLIVSITGLPKKDGIVRNIANTFQVFQDTAKHAAIIQGDTELGKDKTPEPKGDLLSEAGSSSRINLSYNINIILPETTNIEVYNVIFKSLQGNLLR